MNFNNQKINCEIAEILGAFIGDGWIEKRGTALYITGSPTEDKDYYDNYLAPLFSKYFTDVKPKNFPYWGVYGIVTYKRRIIKKAINLKFKAGNKSKSVEIPKEILESKNKEVIKSILRGIFDADGSFFCKKAYGKYDKQWTKIHHCKPRIQLNVVSEKLSKQITYLLKKINIEYNESYRPGGFKHNRNRSPVFIIRIDKLKSIDGWFKEVGTSNPRHKTRYEVWKKLGYLPPNTTIKERRKILLDII